ncbi:MAG: terminase large subunit [Methylococcales bacterium]
MLSAHDKDYVKIAKAFAKGAIRDFAGKKHGLYLRQGAKRFIDDLKYAKKASSEYIFDPWFGDDVCSFIEKLPHVEGRWTTETIVLHPSQVFFLVQLFGFRVRNSAIQKGEWTDRRFTSALYCTGRKSGKSTLAAGILLYCLCCEREIGAQVITAATTFNQANVIFDIAKKMVEKTRDLQAAFGVQVWSKKISRVYQGSTFRPIHAKASSHDGLNPSHIAIDEIHAHKTPDLLNVLTSAAGARMNPLWLYTTTEGYLNPGPWQDLKRFAKSVLLGVFGKTADHFLVVYFACDEENKTLGICADNEYDENAWIKANPLIQVNPSLLVAIRKDSTEAKQMPSRMAEFRIKRLNLPASTTYGWINLTHWNKCSDPVILKDLVDVPCYGGLDLASTIDITSFRLVWIVDDVIYTHGIRWCPNDSINYRTERGTIPYSSWVHQGLMKATPGNCVDYEIIKQDILEYIKPFRVEKIGFDRWNAIELCGRLEEYGLPMIEFIQGPKSFHPAMQALEVAYMSGALKHGGDPCLAWCASNLVPRMDANMNMAPDRKRSADKIDDMVALLMAVGLSTVIKGREPEYDIIVI